MAMRVFADTNWLVAAYFTELDPRRTAIVERIGKKFNVPWVISVVVLMETANTFRMLASNPNPQEWRDLNSDLGSRIEVTDDGWEEISAKSTELVERYSHKRRIGTLDIMILASALKCGATHFLSFDTNSHLRALAAVLKLKVVPELTTEDKTRMAIFR
jgi:predicted nucleic acid-binding protein